MSGAHANWTLEARAAQAERVREWLVGRPVSETTREKIAAAQRGENAYQWRGDDVGYGGAHKRHRAALLGACEECGTTDGRMDVALRPDVPLERLLGDVRRKHLYSLHTEDYRRLCRSCHMRQDRKGQQIPEATRIKGQRASAAYRRGRPLTAEHKARIGAANRAAAARRRELA